MYIKKKRGVRSFYARTSPPLLPPFVPRRPVNDYLTAAVVFSLYTITMVFYYYYYFLILFPRAACASIDTIKRR